MNSARFPSRAIIWIQLWQYSPARVKESRWRNVYSADPSPPLDWRRYSGKLLDLLEIVEVARNFRA